MVKGRVAPPKYLFFILHAANQIEKDWYTLIEQSEYLVLLKIATPYSYVTSS